MAKLFTGEFRMMRTWSHTGLRCDKAAFTPVPQGPIELFQEFLARQRLLDWFHGILPHHTFRIYVLIDILLHLIHPFTIS